MARLTKSQREQVRGMFDGRCAYCGELLGDRWHADHVEAVYRGYGTDGKQLLYADRDTVANMMPACIPCNISKSVFSIDQWRQAIAHHIESLNRFTPIYRMVKRYGLVQETGTGVTFYFERAAMSASKEGK